MRIMIKHTDASTGIWECVNLHSHALSAFCINIFISVLVTDFYMRGFISRTVFLFQRHLFKTAKPYFPYEVSSHANCKDLLAYISVKWRWMELSLCEPDQYSIGGAGADTNIQEWKILADKHTFSAVIHLMWLSNICDKDVWWRQDVQKSTLGTRSI